MQERQIELFDPGSMSADQVLEALNPDLRNDLRSWPALLAELVDVLAAHIKGREKLDPEKAMEKAQDVVVVIAHHFGGRSIYLPRDDRLKRALRDAAIYHAFDGTNHLVLARKTGLTTTQIYNIIYKQRSLRQDRDQMSLPFPE